MKQKLLLFTFLASLSCSLSWAKGTCWGGDEFADANRFFHPEIIEQADYKPFYFSFDRLYDYAWDEPANKYKSNTEEWKVFLGNSATNAEIEELVYETPLNDLRKIWAWVRDKSGTLPEKLKKNGMVKVLSDKSDVATCEYLLFAKSCEPHANWAAGDGWEGEHIADKEGIKQLLNDGKTRCQNAANPFLKMRYAFQLVRLAHYSGDYQGAVAMYDKYAAPITAESTLKYWALAQKAGALKGLGKTAEANYLFSLVFDKCLSKRVPMYYSFKFNKDADWNATYGLCKTPREKATMYLLRAIDPESKTTEEMNNIYQIDPTSEYLTLLLSREVNKVECWLMGYDFNFKYPIEVVDDELYGSNKEALAYLNELTAFVKQKISENKVREVETWQLALGYLQLLQGDFTRANESFNAAKPNLKRDNQKVQLKTLQFLMKIAQVQSVDTKIENELFSEYQKMRFFNERDSLNTLRCMEKTFSRSYETQGLNGKAFLADFGFEPLYSNPKFEAIVDMQKLVEKSGKTLFESYLVKKMGANPKETLKDFEGTHYFREGDLAKAQNLFKQLSAAYQGNEIFMVRANPFNFTVNDCHECAEEKYGKNVKFTKLWVVERMLEMEQVAQADAAKAAENYLLLGNAWYNMSYYGPAWRALAYYRGSSEAELFVDDNGKVEADNHLVVRDMERAIEYYAKAKAATSDKEMQAKCVFGLAKSYQNQQYCKMTTATKWYWTQLSDLKKGFGDTKFYQEALKECTYFSTFVKKK
ncbi:MAG: hypothetical protein ACRCSB_01880 [Bacteroidales bacterium]